MALDMAEKQDAALLDLPAELRVLAAFLQDDERPTVVLGKGQDGEIGEGKPVYQNPAFLHVKVTEEEVRHIASLRELDNTNPWADRTGRRWRRKILGETYTALICEAEPVVKTSTNAVSKEGKGQAEAGAMPPPTRHHMQISDVQLDWLNYPAAGLSPWQEFILNFDWASTSLGPIKAWPSELRTVVLAIMANPVPQVMYVGPEKSFIYNEAFVPMFGKMHPSCMGKCHDDLWSVETLEAIEPYIETALHGQAGHMRRLELHINRSGSLDETFWDALLTPCIGPKGSPFAVLNTLGEVSNSVRGERRRATTYAIREKVSCANTLPQVWSQFLDGLQTAKKDVPWAVFYSADHDHPEGSSQSTDSAAYTPQKTTCTLEGAFGLDDVQDQPRSFLLADDTLTGSAKIMAAAFIKAWQKNKCLILDTDDESLPKGWSCTPPDRGFGDPVKKVAVVPITMMTRRELQGVLVMGLCPRAPWDDEYNLWINLLGEVLTKSAALIAIPMEQQRNHKMSEELTHALSQQLRMITLEAERSDAKFSRMARLSPIGMFIVDAEGRPLYLNDAYRNLIPGSGPDDFRNAQDWTKWIHPDDLTIFWDGWKRLVNEKQPNTCEYRILRDWVSVDKASGEEIKGETWLMATSFPEIESDGRVSAVLGWVNDISAAKWADRLVAKRLEDALENKRQSENFIDMTSHEMRNPLSAILQSADSIVSTLEMAGMPILDESLMLSKDHAEDIIDSAQTILLCAQHQKRIVDDILTLSKLDASLLVISPDAVQPPRLVEKALRMYEGELARADVRASLVIEPTYDELHVDWVMLDPSRLLQVIINLLTNAIKFTQFSNTREITIRLGASAQQPTGAHHGVHYIPRRHGKRTNATLSEEWGTGEDLYLQIAVTDTGHGLSEEDMQVLFQRFAQASPKTYGQYGGSGLGLFISRELCELQGGQIGVRSHGGKTTFTFYVRAKRCAGESDDEGTTLTRVVSNSFISASSSPVVFSRRGSTLVSATLGPSDSHTAQVPERSLSQVLESGNDQLPVPDTTSAVVDDHLHVLIVEDNLINQKVMSQQLRKAGLTVHVANHGLECLDFVERSSFSSPPASPAVGISTAAGTAVTPLSVILLDLEMPTMDGLTCIRHLRDRQTSGEILSHIPVIAVTANARSEQIAKAIEAGMDEVVTKPFRIPELVPQMHRLVAEVRRRGTG